MMKHLPFHECIHDMLKMGYVHSILHNMPWNAMDKSTHIKSPTMGTGMLANS